MYSINCLKVSLIASFLFGSLFLVIVNAQSVSASNYFTAQSFSDHDVPFNISDTGESKPIIWGLDLAWLSEANFRRGIAFMGKDNVDIVRSSFTPTSAITDSTLGDDELSELNERLDIIDTWLGPTDIMLNDDNASVDSYFSENPAHWAELIKITAELHEVHGHTVVSVAPFNEPDVTSTGQGDLDDFYNIAGELRNSSYFDNIRISGANTCNADSALSNYNALKDRLDEGNTHQLAGRFGSYTKFYDTVRANGHHATNDEMHNVMEAIVGVDHGLQTGIWWGTATYARGEFVKASNGVRLAYSYDSDNWTAAAVYKKVTGEVQAFTGGSERQAYTTTYHFISEDRDVYFDGYGPQREYTLVHPGGTGYLSNQPNAERVVNITWGDDIQPVIDGTYILVNRNSGMVIEVPDGSTTDGTYLQQNTNSGASYQQWVVEPVDSTIGEDFSYFSIKAVHSDQAMDLYNFTLDDGGSIDAWTFNEGHNQQWYLDYVKDGWFYIRSKYSAKCIDVADSSTSTGAYIVQNDLTGGESQQWRFLPVDANVEFKAPAAPTNLIATGNAESIQLEWTANVESDIAGYTIFRASSSEGSYNTIARNIPTTSFVDNTATMGETYYYTIKAVDYALNSSEYSNETTATATNDSALVASFYFEENTIDSSENLNHGATYGEISYYEDSTSKAIVLNGDDSFIQLPTNIANQDEISIAARVYWMGAYYSEYLFSFKNSQDEGFSLTANGDNYKLQLAIDYNDETYLLTAPTCLPYNEWSTVAVTMGPKGSKIYLNDSLVVDSSNIAIRPADIKPFLNYIGRDQTENSLFNGYIDEFRLYNYVLSEEQLNEIFPEEETDTSNIVDTTNSTISITSVNEENSLVVWPQPVSDILNIAFQQQDADSYSLQIYTLDGTMLTEKNDVTGSTQMDVSSYREGMYILKLYNKESSVIQPIIVNH